jgi:hypothetical protein
MLVQLRVWFECLQAAVYQPRHGGYHRPVVNICTSSLLPASFQIEQKFGEEGVPVKSILVGFGLLGGARCKLDCLYDDLFCLLLCVLFGVVFCLFVAFVKVEHFSKTGAAGSS